jgi:hypothetical protein
MASFLGCSEEPPLWQDVTALASGFASRVGTTAGACFILALLAAGRHEVRFGRRLPSWRRNRPLPARAKPHRAWLLPSKTRRVGLRSLCSTCSASNQIDAVAQAARLFEIERSCRSVHLALKLLDSV